MSYYPPPYRFHRRDAPPEDPPERVFVPEVGDDPWDVPEGAHLLLTGRGAFVVHRTALYSYARRATLHDFAHLFGPTGAALESVYRWAAMRLKCPIPLSLLEQAQAFFIAVCKRYKSEDILFLHFLLSERRYLLSHPVLTYADAQGVGFEVPAAPPGAVTLGTIHSHPFLPAVHSERDDGDVAGVPGLHIVMGDLDRRCPSLGCYLSTGKTCFEVDPGELFEPASASVEAFPTEWLVRPADLPKYLPRKRKESEKGATCHGLAGS